MSESNQSQQCGRCGSPLRGYAPDGLCAPCLLECALEPKPALDNPEAAPRPTIKLAPLPETEETPGMVIGRYKLLEKIGEGGFGVVYVAEQREPVKRRVALKVIKLGMDTRQIVARFEAERQALAMMDHPNIAKVFDAGATEAGRPYFVMELVKGIRITDYCDQNHLGTRERLELFMQVCQAVQHAHQKGIIHRDIKPSNILVTLHDGVPVPKVIDFGIAKATEQPLTEKTIYTAFGQFMGTPAYMSPEQAELSGLDIDTRSDIYSLGVLLYELLTGHMPFDPKRLVKAGIDEIRRIIREEEPPRPSTRLSTLGAEEQTTVAKCRGAEMPRLVHQVRGDLDWIVMKCLEKDRKRRYETANGLASEIKRFLDNEPVSARPPSNIYRLQKLVRRNKLAFTALAAVLSLLLVIAIGSPVALFRINQERQKAQSHAKTAGEQRERAEQLLGTAESALYQTRLNENRALRLARPDGWSEIAFRNLSSNITTHLSERDVVMLRSEAAACMEDIDVRLAGYEASHGMEILSLDFSPDSALLATADYGLSRIWDLTTAQVGRPLKVLREFKDSGVLMQRYVNPCIRFSPRGGAVAYGTRSNSVEVVALANREESILKLTSSAYARWLGYDREGSIMAVMWADGRLIAYDVPTGKPINDFSTPGIEAAAISPDGKTLAMVGKDQTVELRNLDGQSLPVALGKHRGRVANLNFSPEGDLLASASEDRTAKLFDVKTAKESFTLLGHKARVHAAVFRNDGRLVATVSDDQTARLWDSHTGQSVLTIRPETAQLKCAAFSPNGQRLALGKGSTIALYDLINKPAKKLLFGHTYGLNDVAFHPDKPVLASASADNSLRLWDVDSGETIVNLPGHPAGHPRGVAFSPDGALLAVGHDGFSNSGTTDHGVRLWKTTTNQLHSVLPGHNTNVQCVAFDAAGILLASGDDEGSVITHSISTEKELMRWEQKGDAVVALNFASPGYLLLMVHRSGKIRLGDCISGEIVAQINGAAKLTGVTGVAASRLNNQLAVGTFRGAIHSFRLPDLSPISSFQAHATGYCKVAYSPDGQLLASGSWDRRVMLWHPVTGAKLLELPPPESSIRSLAFDADGKRLAIASVEEQITIWDLGLVRQRLRDLRIDWEDTKIAPEKHPRDHLWPGVIIKSILSGNYPSSTNSLKLANWAAFLARLPADDPAAISDADALSLKALELAPEETDAWAQRFEFLLDRNRQAEVTALFDLAAEKHQNSPLFWNRIGLVLKKSGRLEDGYNAFTKVVEFASTNSNLHEGLGKEALLHRAAILQKLKRPGEALLDCQRALDLPARDAKASANLLDLTTHYNGSLDGWLPPGPYGTSVEKSLIELPRGVQEFAGVLFDVRGIVQIGNDIKDLVGDPHPAQATGISVKQKCRLLSFLHGLIASVPGETVIGRYVVHYEDGQQLEAPITYGDNIKRWVLPPPQQSVPHAVVAWTGKNAFSERVGQELCLYKFSWENPRLDSVVSSIDFVSFTTPCAPFLIAVTAEP